ncbi:MAG: hypothetical protein SD837_15170 [Candidatus Electrothrix scaldis]|nr:MAG: hypothetical protein SD837_15170 [Candidatus Electrothrix sp. GW3-3]
MKCVVNSVEFIITQELVIIARPNAPKATASASLLLANIPENSVPPKAVI